MPIRVLDATVAAQIAAGEVVERPASVVKELVENALDAGAQRVQISVRGGGIEELVIQDDGHGIPAGEVELAFARHATSKLTTADDLWAIATLGFRGEALPSIAAVAQVTCTTRTRDAALGVELRVAGGVIQERTTKGCMPGTTFSIRNLFYNIPVRRSFLKSAGAEAAAITSVVTQYALAYPAVRFTLTRDDREIFHTIGSGHLPGTVLSIYGLDVARQLLPVELTEGDGPAAISVRGLVSPPTLTRGSREAMHLTVNGRAVAPRGQLAAIIEDAYHTLLMKGRFPIVVLQITVPPATVDVNVHPTKSEVKFRDPQQVGRVLSMAIRSVVQGTVVIAGWDTGTPATEDEPPEQEVILEQAIAPLEPAPDEAPPAAAVPDRGMYRPRDPDAGLLVRERPAPPPAASTPDVPHHPQVRPAPSSVHAPAPPAMPRVPPAADPPANIELPLEPPAPPAGVPPARTFDPPPPAPPAGVPPARTFDPPPPAPPAGVPPARTFDPPPPAPPAGAPPAQTFDPPPSSLPASIAPARTPEPATGLPPLRALAQLAQTYLLAEGPDGALYLIDQHAAHERITYERLLTQAAAGAVEAQALLIPQSIPMPPATRETLLAATNELARWGLTVEEVPDGVQVQALPASLAPEDLTATLLDLAGHLQGQGGRTPDQQQDHMLATLACHTSVRAGQTLSRVEQQALIDQLAACTGPRTCPHGRPTVIMLTLQQLARQFGRLG